MFSDLAKSFPIHLATGFLLALAILAGCQASDPVEQAGLNQMAGNQEADRMPVNIHASSIQQWTLPPRDVQDLVNRSHAIVIGTISAISDPVNELPYFTTEADFEHRPPGQLPYLEVAYYDITIEEVLLDDGNVRAHPRLRLEPNFSDQDPSWTLPEMGKRYLFTMGRNPDSLSYGVSANWMTLTLDGDSIRYIDGTSPGYVGVTNEASLVKAIREAVPNHDFLPVGQWPDRFAAIEGDGDGEEPAAPGGSGGDDVGPTGDTGGGSGN